MSNDSHQDSGTGQFATSRRQFAGWLGGTGLLALTGCGGGGSDAAPPPASPPTTPSPEPPPAAPAPTTPPAPTAPPVSPGALSLLAGGLGGAGFLEARGALARLTRPGSLALGKDGAVYFASDLRIGRISAEGDVDFLANFPYITVSGMACDSRGVLYACANGVGVIYRLVEEGTPRFEVFAGKFQPYPNGGFTDGVGEAALLRLPRAPVFDRDDNMYFIDADNRAIRKVAPNGTVTTVAGQPLNNTMVDGQGAAAGFEQPVGMVLLPDGDFLILDRNRWRKMTPGGLVTSLPGTVPAVSSLSLAVIDANSIYAIQGHSIVRLGLDGTLSPLAGVQDAPGYVEAAGSAARFNMPSDLVLTAGGSLLVTDTENAVIRSVAPPSGQTAPWAGAAPQPGRVDGAAAQARFAAIGAIATDGSGNAYLIDTAANSLRRITADGAASTLFQDFPSDGGLAVDTAGSFYGVRNRTIVKVSPAGAQTVLAGQAGTLGFADGPGADARFANPLGLAIDGQGNLLVGDAPQVTSGPPFSFVVTLQYGNTIRRITPAGEVSTIAGIAGRIFQTGGAADAALDPAFEFRRPVAIALDAQGRVLVLDTSSGGTIRRLGPAGSAPILVAGSFALSSAEGWLTAFGLTPSGDVYFSQTHSASIGQTFSSVRKVEADGSTRVVAGEEREDRFGVLLGSLPGSLGAVTAMVGVSDKLLYLCSENSVLRVQLP